MCLGIPGLITEILDAATMTALADVGGVSRSVNITCIVDDQHPPTSCVGDWVLIHVGFAMSRIDEAEAARSLALLKALGEMQHSLDATS